VSKSTTADASPAADLPGPTDRVFLSIAEAYVRLIGPERRSDFPLRAHGAEPDLLAQLDALEPARGPVADSAARVLSGYVWTQSAPVPERVEQDGHPVLRDSDHAVAWRYPLGDGDRHLLYWQPASGPVSLARIAEASSAEDLEAAAKDTPAAGSESRSDAPVLEDEATVPEPRGRGRGTFTIDDGQLVAALREAGRPLMVSELRAALQIPQDVSADVVRRVLDNARGRGVITRTGERRGTRYDVP
jgi:hypothetical protein